MYTPMTATALPTATLAIWILPCRFDGGIEVHDPAVAYERPEQNREDEMHERSRPAVLVQLPQSGYDQTAEEDAEPGA